MKITIVADSKKSWFYTYANILYNILKENHEAIIIHSLDELNEGDIAFYLSFTQICTSEKLALNKNNIVIHASNLPKGKGWSPMHWEVLEGSNKITLTLFEAIEKIDSGGIYFKDYIEFEGHELLDELREKLALKIIAMSLNYVQNYPMIANKQEGEETFYPRRKPEDSELDINKTIEEQFNLMRIADNDRFPLFFHKNNQKYILKIYKCDNES